MITDRVTSTNPVAVCCTELLGQGASVGLHTLSGYVLKSSIGVGGSALYGLFSSLVARPIGKITNSAFGVNEENPNPYLSVLSAAGSFFAGAACSWGITNAILKTKDRFSYPDSLALSGVAGALSLAIVLPIVCTVYCCTRNRAE